MRALASLVIAFGLLFSGPAFADKNADAYYKEGLAFKMEGKVDEAIAHYQRAPEQFRTTGMAMAEFTRGNDAASRALLAKMETDFAVGFAYQIAQIHAWRGEKDEAFQWLDRCFPIHDAGLVRLPFDPALDPLRSDPRFAAIVARMGIPK
jgi:tetratricopeptide (TPR) repeat protein